MKREASEGSLFGRLLLRANACIHALFIYLQCMNPFRNKSSLRDSSIYQMGLAWSEAHSALAEGLKVLKDAIGELATLSYDAFKILLHGFLFPKGLFKLEVEGHHVTRLLYIATNLRMHVFVFSGPVQLHLSALFARYESTKAF